MLWWWLSMIGVAVGIAVVGMWVGRQDAAFDGEHGRFEPGGPKADGALC